MAGALIQTMQGIERQIIMSTVLSIEQSIAVISCTVAIAFLFHGQSKFQGTKYHSNIWQPLQNRSITFNFRSLWHQRSIIGSTSMLDRRWWTIDRHLMNDRSSPTIDCHQPLIDADECSIVGDDPTIDRCRWTIVANNRLCLYSVVLHGFLIYFPCPLFSLFSFSLSVFDLPFKLSTVRNDTFVSLLRDEFLNARTL